MMTRTIAGGIAAMLLFGAPAARADVVSDWNAILLATVAAQNPFAQARYAAITHLAIFEAVNAIDRRYQPYLGTVTAPPGASAEAAAVAAAHRVLATYFPANAAALDAARVASLAAIPNGWAKDAGIAIGEAAAIAMIAARADDGSAPAEFYVPSSSEPGEWQLTPSCPPAGGVLLHWRNLTPFGIARGDRFRSAPPPVLSGHRYARAYREVKDVGSADSLMRPQDKADLARFYAAVPAALVWNPAIRQVAAAQGRSLPENARAFALLNMAMSDAAIAVFDTKYHYTFWRPETAIRAGDTDGNPKTEPDPGFMPFIVTPCFPSYGSAHASLGGAARAVAERVFGEDGHAITLSTPALPGIVLEYASFEEIGDDIDDARVYGGIHFRFDQTAGVKQGRRVGTSIVTHHLRPSRGPHR
jgi:hypothetical protein